LWFLSGGILGINSRGIITWGLLLFLSGFSLCFIFSRGGGREGSAMYALLVGVPGGAEAEEEGLEEDKESGATRSTALPRRDWGGWGVKIVTGRWRLGIQVKGAGLGFERGQGVGGAVVLAKMLGPGRDHEGFDVATGDGGVGPEAPMGGTVTQALQAQLVHEGRKFGAALGVDMVFDVDHHGATIGVRLRGDQGFGPMAGGGEILLLGRREATPDDGDHA
jgi:hypothetical protein